ncbi:DUF4236 domain-containing protein [Aquibacillus albus]|uniref:DUF4236 domain-containing protein n=1 Tax=Aquibacillus albus TaxID=1168171 RepID=A0ABS2N4F2_9BACI|nr:DUF4236 domain-containing protein [Aquibacillus albus]MBM7573024.1 hypothetical protein [Aquibacillus albus]
MGFRFRKSIKVAPRVRMNVGTKGISTSIGSKGARVNVSKRGLSTGSSIPGTGISYNQRIGSRKKRAQRTSNERIKEQQQFEVEKENQYTKAEAEVERFESRIDMLTRVHEEASDGIDWNEILSSPRPFPENEDGPHVQNIKATIQNYKPTWRDKLFNRVEARLKIWEESLPEEQEKDLMLVKQWEQAKANATSILNRDISAWTAILEEINPFEDIIELGNDITYVFDHDGKHVTVRLEIENKQVIPETTLSLTKTGKLSQRKMAKGKYFQLYQDYVCSCVLRVIRELFAIFPIEMVQVNVYDYSTADESEDYGCILSVMTNRSQIESTTFTNIDCSDIIEQFKPHMKFLKTKGFKFVEEVQ